MEVDDISTIGEVAGTEVELELKSEVTVVISADAEVVCTVGSKSTVGLVNSINGDCVDFRSPVSDSARGVDSSSPARVVSSTPGF